MRTRRGTKDWTTVAFINHCKLYYRRFLPYNLRFTSFVRPCVQCGTIPSIAQRMSDRRDSILQGFSLPRVEETPSVLKTTLQLGVVSTSSMCLSRVLVVQVYRNIPVRNIIRSSNQTLLLLLLSFVLWNQETLQKRFRIVSLSLSSLGLFDTAYC